MPVYNVMPYLERAVNSVLAQTFSDFELILVDDGSTDGSSELCDALAKKDGRIRVVHQSNGGCSYAMGVGVSHSKGEYICFADSDDFALPEMCERLYTAIETHGADLVRGNILRIPMESAPQPLPLDEQGYNESWRDGWFKSSYLAGSFDFDAFMRDFFENNRINAIYQMIIRRSQINERNFRKDLHRSTDLYFWLNFFLQEPAPDLKVLTIPDAQYIYFSKRPGSIVSGTKGSFAARESWLEVRLLKVALCTAKCLPMAYRQSLKELFSFCLSGKVDITKRDHLNPVLRTKALHVLRKGYWVLIREGGLSCLSKTGLTVFCISPRLYYPISRALSRLRRE